MDKKEKKLKKKIKSDILKVEKIAIVLLILLGIIAVVLYSTYKNTTEMEKQLRQNLADVAKQNGEILRTKIQEKYNLLNSLAKELEGVTPENIEEELGQFRVFLNDMDLKRFAYCFPDGTTYSTDGGFEDLSYRDFYKRGMEGDCSITGVLQDALLNEHNPVNVMTIPVEDEDGNPVGVFGLAYDTENFNKSLDIESFDGQGYSCIINEKGEIMAATGGRNLELTDNLFEDVLSSNEENKDTIAAIKKQIEEKTENGGVMYLSEKNYYYCVPVALMDGCVNWYIITSVSSEELDQRLNPIQRNQYRTSFIVIVLVSIGFLLIIFSIKESHKKSMQLACENSVTEGPNFQKFCLDMENRKNKSGYLIALYIANFDSITIVAGEEKARGVIREIWEVIREEIEKDELAAYIRDEKFLLFLSEPDDKSLIRRMEQLSRKINRKTKDLDVYGVQAGYGVYTMTENEPFEKAYSKAKIAREHVAANPEQKYVFYKEVDRVKTQQEKQLEERFTTALADQEFEVWYQPKYSAETGSIVGSEALVRWREKDGNLISPGAFIPLFERNGMIKKLDEYMFHKVCIEQRKRLEEGKKIYPVSVNLSRASMYRADVVSRYSEIMKKYDMKPEYVQIEITESILGGKNDMEEFLKEFRKMGIKVLMDDFGTGYSSLSTLSTQCFDILKLDKSLIDRIGNRDGEILLEHIVQMAQQMGLRITAEGVEKAEQVQFLQNVNCDDIQGFYFSRPLPEKEYESLLDSLE